MFRVWLVEPDDIGLARISNDLDVHPSHIKKIGIIGHGDNPPVVISAYLGEECNPYKLYFYTKWVFCGSGRLYEWRNGKDGSVRYFYAELIA